MSIEYYDVSWRSSISGIIEWCVVCKVEIHGAMHCVQREEGEVLLYLNNRWKREEHYKNRENEG